METLRQAFDLLGPHKVSVLLNEGRPRGGCQIIFSYANPENLFEHEVFGHKTKRILDAAKKGKRPLRNRRLEPELIKQRFWFFNLLNEATKGRKSRSIILLRDEEARRVEPITDDFNEIQHLYVGKLGFLGTKKARFNIFSNPEYINAEASNVKVSPKALVDYFVKNGYSYAYDNSRNAYFFEKKSLNQPEKKQGRFASLLKRTRK